MKLGTFHDIGLTDADLSPERLKVNIFLRRGMFAIGAIWFFCVLLASSDHDLQKTRERIAQEKQAAIQQRIDAFNQRLATRSTEDYRDETLFQQDLAELETTLKMLMDQRNVLKDPAL